MSLSLPSYMPPMPVAQMLETDNDKLTCVGRRGETLIFATTLCGPCQVQRFVSPCNSRASGEEGGSEPTRDATEWSERLNSTLATCPADGANPGEATAA